jgi:hypothetical protein
MKKWLKLFGLIALVAMVGFMMTACPTDSNDGDDDNGDGTGDGTGDGGGKEIDGGFLTEGVWKDGEITVAGGNVTYKVSVDTGTTYHFWWNEIPPNGNGTKTLDVSVSVNYSDGSAVVPAINAHDNAWTTARTFISTKKDTVNVKITAKEAEDTGTFAIVFRTGTGSVSRPSTLNFPANPDTLTLGEWKSGEFTSSITEIWYTFADTSNFTTNFSFWWNDSKEGNGSATADVLVSIWTSNESAQFVDIDSAWRTRQTFSSSLGSTPTYYVRVTPKNLGGTGTFNVVYNTSNTKPWLTPVVTTPLTANEWKNDSIAVGSSGEKWYSFTSTGGTRYVWWNDRKEGNGSATLDVEVSAYSSTGSSLISSGYQDSGWRSSDYFSTTAGSTYYIRVMSATEGDTGSFDLVFTSTSTWPWLAPTITTPLTAGVWKDDEITGDTGSEKWYTFTAGSGTYRVWANDGGSYVYYGDGLKTLSIQVAGWRNEGNSLFSNTGSIWNTPENPTLASGDVVYVRVRPYSAGNTGTYGIVYTENNAVRPLTFDLPTTATALTKDVWTDGNITGGAEAWYSIALSSSNRYYLWWNDSKEGNGTKNLDVVVGAWFENGDRAYEYVRMDDGWLSSDYFSSSTHTAIYIKVSPKTAGETGTFAIAYNEGYTPARPWVIPINSTPLTAGQWTDSSISDSDGELWFTFTASATTYYFWKNDYDKDGTKNAGITITFYSANGTLITYDANTTNLNGWIDPYQIVVSSTGTVYVRVTRSRNGTFGLAYATSASSPRPPTSIIFPAESSMTALVLDTWTNGEITGSASEIWYKITNSTGSLFSCRIWWNDKGQGDNSKTLDVCVSAWDDKEQILFVGNTASTPAMNLDSGWTTYGIGKTLYSNNSIYIRVTPKIAGETGTFGIVCNSSGSSTRPD